MVRVLAYCLNAKEGLSFTKGLSAVEEPDLWVKSLTNELDLWIDVGEPAADRIKKASGISKEVKVYSFNSKSNAWWNQDREKFLKTGATFYQLPNKQVTECAKMIERTTDMSITISGDSAFLAMEKGEGEISWIVLE